MPLETSLGANGIMTITFANQKKLNAWTQPMMEGFFDCLQEAGRRSDVAGVVVTGEGKYYSAGVDLSNVMKPMLPSNLVIYLRDSNQKVFQTVIDFPKPIVAAVNGPALGAAVTTATLMGAPPASSRCPASAAQPPPPSLRRPASPLDAADSIVASEVATFSLPFAKLGVPPEGCSSALFVEHMGEATAQRILGPEAWIPTAAQAMDVGFPTVDEVVPGGNAECVARAVEVSNQV
jgi:peroxisomal 3,2-trans-enoyl-CoA isomerase